MRIFYFAIVALGVSAPLQAYARECQLPSGKIFTTPHLCEEIAPNAVESGRSAALPFSSHTQSPQPKMQSVTVGRQYIRGPKGGCYYINRNGNKSYVDRSLCN